jgi:hypothetical protein
MARPRQQVNPTPTRSADARQGNCQQIFQAIGTNPRLCCHTCAKTQHKPLSRKAMRAQIAPMKVCSPFAPIRRAAMAAGGQ